MTDILRALRHLCAGGWQVRRRFDRRALDAIEAAIGAGEAGGHAEIRFAVESGLPLRALWRGLSPRARAVEVFSDLHLWDTELRRGVLIYLLLADRDVEIVADRGLREVSAARWERCCRVMEEHFAAGRFGPGAVAGIRAVAEILASHTPPAGAQARRNELPDAPTLL